MTRIIVAIFVLSAIILAEDIYTYQAAGIQNLINGKNRHDSSNRPKIGLVLSGGGARGLAHVGVLRALEKYNIPIDLIVGTSMGSVVGGFYAAGYTADELEEIVRSIEWETIFSDETARENLFLGQKLEKDRYLLNIRFEGLSATLPTSITSGQRILSIISEKLYGANLQMIYNFDDLNIPFRCVATDLITGKRVILDKGDLAEAINASTAVPLLFAPVSWDSLWLVDGGLSSNLPVDVARSEGVDIVIAVDITSPLRNRNELGAPWEIADQVTTIMMLKQYMQQMDMADVLIKPELEEFGSSDFDKFDTLMQRGEEAVDSVAGSLIHLLDNTAQLSPEQEFFVREVEVFIDSVRSYDFSELLIYKQRNMSVTKSSLSRVIESLRKCGEYKTIHVAIEDSVLIYHLNRYPEINGINIKGNRMLPDSVLRPLFAPLVHKRLNDALFANQLEQIRTHYTVNGYILMHFDSLSMDMDNSVIDLKIDEGVIDSIAIIGNAITRDLIILREFPVEPGDIYDSKTVQKGIENIFSTQLFEKVSVNVDKSSDMYTLRIKVKEKSYTVLRLGGQINSQRGVQGYFQIANENLFGTSGKLSLSGRYGERDRSIGINFRTDRLFESFLTMGLYGIYDWKINPIYQSGDKIGEYLEERSGFRFVLGQQLRKFGQMSVELRVENVKDNPYSGTFTFKQNSEIRTLTIRSVTDKRDQISFTTSGIYNIWYWEAGNEKIFEGQEKYSKFFVNLEGHYTYWQYHTFHIKGVIGVGDRTLPFSEFFRIGGLESFMGLNMYESTGRQVIYTNLEYSFKIPYFRIFSDTYLGFRYDLGGVWENPDLVLESEDFIYGIGAWLGIDTVLGPLVFAVGDTANRSPVYYASLGYNF